MVRAWLALLAVGCVTRAGSDDTGEADAPDVSVEPTAIVWGTVGSGCAEVRPLVVRNVGTAPLRITGIDVDPQVAFSVAAVLPREVAPRAGATFDLVFAPGAAGSYAGTISVYTDDPDEPEVVVPISGDAESDAATDTFTQPEPENVDVLWVIDQSCSMYPYLGEVADLVGSYTDALRATDTDFQMGFTTVEMEEGGAQGHLLGTPLVRTSAMTTEAIVAEFTSTIAVEPGSPITEKPLAAAYAALGDPGHAVAAGLVRADARLQVIVVGDEEDQSGQPAATWVQWLDGYKASADDTRIDALLLGASGGGNPFGNAICEEFLGAPMLTDIAAATGGQVLDPCASNVDSGLGSLANATAGVLEQVGLSSEPANGASGMTVTIGGAPATMDPFRAEGWSYDLDTNAVHLHGSALPEPGDEIVVTYPVDVCP